MTLDEAYVLVHSRWTDLQAVIPTIEYHLEKTRARTVIELGVRTGVSTVVFLHALRERFHDAVGARGTVYSIDTEWPVGPFMPMLNEIAASKGLGAWKFIHGDDLDPKVRTQLPNEADIVFIDTSHEYVQTMDELDAYLPLVKQGGRVLLHDALLKHAPSDPEPPDYPVRQAMEDFCHHHDLWYEIESFEDAEYGSWTNGCKNSLGVIYA